MNRCLFELILAVKRKCQCNEEQIQDELDLSAAEFHGLMALDRGQAILGGQFAQQMGLSPSRGSRVLNRLVMRGWVEAQLSQNDRRSIFVSLTDQGVHMKERITEHMKACESRICNKLNKADVQQIQRALEMLTNAL